MFSDNRDSSFLKITNTNNFHLPPNLEILYDNMQDIFDESNTTVNFDFTLPATLKIYPAFATDSQNYPLSSH
jgi:hypothetical protein